MNYKKISCSEQTKINIANSLKELMLTIPFDKITISDITNKCEIHRQTFYYHFQDKYELVDWLIYNEIIENLVADFNYGNATEKFYELFKKIKKDEVFYQNIVKVGSGELFKYLSHLSKDYLEIVIEDSMERNNIKTKNNVNTIVAEFFGFGLGGMIISWIENGLQETPENMTELVNQFIVKFVKLSK